MKLNARCSRAACATSFRAEDKKRKEQMKTLSKITLAAAALALLGIAAALAHGDKGKHSDERWKTIVIDVANDSRSAVPPIGGPPPKRGDTLLVNGKVFPGGTIPAGDGLDIDTLTGSIGTWLTRHTFNVDLSQILAGAHPALSSTQYYLFSPTGVSDGEEALFSEGHHPSRRARRDGPLSRQRRPSVSTAPASPTNATRSRFGVRNKR